MNRTRLLLIVAIFAVVTLGCRQPTSERNTAADERSVNEVGKLEISAFSVGDIGGNLAVMTEDVVLMPANEPMREGKDGVREWLEGIHKEFALDVRYVESHVDISGDTAIQRYTGVATLTPKAGGAPIEDRFKGIHVYRRQPDGSWLIAQDIWNSDLPAASSPTVPEEAQAPGPRGGARKSR